MGKRSPLSLKKRLRGRRLLENAAWSLLTLAGGVLLGTAGIYFFGALPVEELKHPNLAQTTILYDRSGTQELYRIYDEANRQIITHAEIPNSVRLATIASEDERFLSHYGVDPAGILRAMIVNVRSQEIEQGASTITQQLARSLFLSREQTWKRKLGEIFLALKMENHFTKDEILDLYLNTVPYGSNAYGIETAAQTFFGKKAANLTLEESALLAALPNAPTFYSPYRDGRLALLERQKNILKKMRTLEFISQEELKAALAEDILAHVIPPKRPILAPHFVFFILEELEKEYGQALPRAGLRVITTLDSDLQKLGESAVLSGAERNRSRRAENAALVALDAEKGEILAMIGSKDYFDASIDGEVNLTTSLRQPGSAFKPIIYAAAFEKGFQPETPIYDIPIDFGPDGQGGRYVPNNYDGGFRGRLSMRQALAGSLNIPAVTTLALTGLDYALEFAGRLGITTLTDPSRYGLSLVLGGAEVRPLDMASAFAVFGREGERIPPTPILRIERNGEEVTPAPAREKKRVIDPEVARKINSILTDNEARAATFGSTSPLAFPRGLTVAAKTGTTQNFRDAWTVGYTSRLSVAVWVGNNDNQAMVEGSDGIYVAAPIWRAFMDGALKYFPETDFTPYAKSTESSALFGLGALENDLHYFDRKNDREISEAEARDLKESRVKRISTADLILEQARENSGEDGRPVLTSIETIKKLYQPRQAEAPR